MWALPWRILCTCSTITTVYGAYARLSVDAPLMFSINSEVLTRYLRVVLEPYAMYWGHRSFWRACNSFFAADGIHLNSRGQYKLHCSLRGAVLKSLQVFISDGNFLFLLLFIPIKCFAVIFLCQPLILLFSRCVFAHDTDCMSAFDFTVKSLPLCARNWLGVSL